MAVHTNGKNASTPTADGVGADPGEAVLRSILPKVLDAVGNGLYPKTCVISNSG